jgi:membrane protein YdbS with pleckstrin-like domain
VSDSSELDLWAEKPWWCQPWTIILTGVLAVSGSWLVVHRLWITIPLATIVLAWWILFLVIAPAAYRNQPR